MHILLTNDDGPPSNQSSPYIHSLATILQSAGHTVSVVLPHVQRSWIGKAHIIGQTLTPSYFRPGTLHQDDGITSHHPFADGKEEWVLIDGTPASCVQIGLWHLYRERGPVDLVVSGPNYGRNTTALFSLSSGTIGGALEGAVCGRRAVALSYAFDSRSHDPDAIKAASTVSQRLIERLVRDWPDDVHLYSVNVPLRRDVTEAKILYTDVLQNQWSTGSSFEEVEVDEELDSAEQEMEIREGGENESGNDGERNGTSIKRKQKKFKWAPKFSDVYESVQEAGPGNDGWAVKEGCVSVTPLKANFWHVSNIKGEIKLCCEKQVPADQNMISPSTAKIYAIINYPDAYVQPLIIDALKRQSKSITFEFISSIEQLPSPDSPLLQFTAYEWLDFEHALNHPRTSLSCAYVIRKALIRKHYLSNTISTWLVKHPESPLKRHFKAAVNFELDYAEFLDEALVDAWDLNESMKRNEEFGDDYGKKEWWILKPGMSDGGNGIRIFSSLEQLRDIFEQWEGEEENVQAEEADSGDEDGDDDSDGLQDAAYYYGDELASLKGTMCSQLRHFVAQPYIDPPLLLISRANRKFHMRVYVLAVGPLKVYVFKEVLTLFAARSYKSPSEMQDGGEVELSRHLTNTCFQDESTREGSVTRFWQLEEANLGPDWKERIFDQVCEVTGEVFEAAAREQMIHFQAIPNAFEIFGLDFLVDGDQRVWLLEVNSYPDFKQTGQRLQDVVVATLFREVIDTAVGPFFTSENRDTDELASGEMVLVKEIDLGRR